MTVPPTQPTVPPPDQEEIVEVVNQPGAYRQRRIVRSSTVEQRLLISRIIQVMWMLFGFLEALIGIRIVLKLIGANPGAFFTQVIYGLTDLFLWPFAGITPDPGVGAFQLEISSIIAMIVYGLIAWGLTRLIWVLFYHPETSSTTTYREERY
jgi:YggT family protein